MSIGKIVNDISFKDYKTLIEEDFHDEQISKDSIVKVNFKINTPQGTEGYALIVPDDARIVNGKIITNYMFKIRYFILTTPEEVQGNILAIGLNDKTKRLLTDNQAENQADVKYDASNWDDKGVLYLKGFMAYGFVSGYNTSTGTTNVVTTADRTLVLKYCGTLVRRV